MKNKMNGHELNALVCLNEKMQAMTSLITLMVKTHTNQRTLANKAGVNYETVKKMIKQPAHGSLELWEHLLNTLLKEVEND